GCQSAGCLLTPRQYNLDRRELAADVTHRFTQFWEASEKWRNVHSLSIGSGGLSGVFPRKLLITLNRRFYWNVNAVEQRVLRLWSGNVRSAAAVGAGSCGFLTGPQRGTRRSLNILVYHSSSFCNLC